MHIFHRHGTVGWKRLPQHYGRIFACKFLVKLYILTVLRQHFILQERKDSSLLSKFRFEKRKYGDKLALAAGRVELDVLQSYHSWEYDISQIYILGKEKALLWTVFSNPSTLLNTKGAFETYEWNLPYTTLYWKSDGIFADNLDNLHLDLKFIPY